MINPANADHEWIMEQDKVRVEMLKHACGKVQVLATHDPYTDIAHYGDITGLALLKSGGKGAITDGNTRDLAILKDMKFPLAFKDTSVVDSIGSWSLVNFDTDVRIKDTMVGRNDIIHLSSDGAIVFSRLMLEEIVPLAIERHARESKIRNLMKRKGVMYTYNKIGRW